MWNKPTKRQLAAIAPLYSNEDTPIKEQIVHMHFFLGGSDWYVTEFDGRDLFFGFVILNQDHDNSEWGYFSLSELEAIKKPLVSTNGFVFGHQEVDRDKWWTKTPVSEIPTIKTFE